MPIDPASLSNPAYYGLACVVCGRPFATAEQPDRVGLVGDDLHAVYACPGDCARTVTEPVVERRYHTSVLRRAAAGRSAQPSPVPDRPAAPNQHANPWPESES